MKMIVKGDPYQLIDSTLWCKGGNPEANVTIQPGKYEVELIKCPTGFDCNWFVLKGTKIGASERSLLDYPNGVVSILDDNGKLLELKDD